MYLGRLDKITNKWKWGWRLSATVPINLINAAVLISQIQRPVSPYSLLSQTQHI